MDFAKIKKIYMIGIKGVGMTMLAQYLSKNGADISGSDVAEKFMTDEVLKKAGIKVIETFSAANIPKDADLIIYSSAYSAEQNEEVAYALKAKTKAVTYAEALGEIFNQKYGIAVTGTHGKTTTTAWLGYVARKAGLEPSVMVGARVPQFNGAGLAGKSDYLVIEADEYQDKLKYYNPKAVLLNNIEYDHPDFFSTPAAYQDVFMEFIKKIPKKGFLVANFDDPVIREMARVNCRGKVIAYAIDEAADYMAYDIKLVGDLQYFKVKLGAGEGDSNANNMDGAGSTGLPCRRFAPPRNDKEDLGEFCVQLAGKHNISNALAVIAACVELGVELKDIRQYLEEFKGTARRMQIMGNFRGATIIDDYAHHPTEIKATLTAVRELYKYRKITVVFHPHTFTRTKVLLDDFARSFGEADEVIILDIYGSTREKRGGVSSQDLVKKIKAAEADGMMDKDKLDAIPFIGAADLTVSARYIPTLDECEKYLRENVERDDVIVLMGAGDVFRIGESLTGK